MENRNLYEKACRISEQIIKVILRREKKGDDLEEWIESNPVAREVIADLTTVEVLTENIENFVRPEKTKGFQLLQKRIRRRKRRKQIGLVSGVAAGVMLFAGLTVLFTKENPIAEQINTVDEYAPRLILGNGQNLNLKSLSGNWMEKNGMGIKNDGENGIAYFVEENEDSIEKAEVINTLIIPRQCTYHVVLSDGTIVYMNADSRLEYPVEFVGNERRVKLEGEAYFEVSKEAKPFVVSVHDVEVRVYGTKFDINAYHEDRIETVLLEGKVGISWQNQEQILHRAQLSKVNKITGEHLVAEVETSKYISWMKGYLRYDDDQLEQMMEDLSRWYGVDFEFGTESMKTMRITASINKDLSLDTVLAMIRSTIKVTFIKQERGYLISQPF